MTIAIAVKVKEGIVLASDSMGTQTDDKGDVRNFCDKTAKIFQLHEDFPVGIVAYGSSTITGYPLSLLVSDFRDCLSDPAKRIDRQTYDVQKIAGRFKEVVASQCNSRASDQKTGFLIAGYSSSDGHRSAFGEVWEIVVTDGIPQKPIMIIDQHLPGLVHRGMDKPLIRMLAGFEDRELERIMKYYISDDKTISKIIRYCEYDLEAHPITDTTPIGNVAELAVFLVETTTYYTRFCCTGSDSMGVGGSVQIATISRYKGFEKVRLVTRPQIYH
ncbi:MAG: hypothetical protein V1792_23570 [Pseudomonadota bacterium]